MQKYITVISYERPELSLIRQAAKKFTQAQIIILSPPTLKSSDISHLMKQVKGTVIYYGLDHVAIPVRRQLRTRLIRRGHVLNLKSVRAYKTYNKFYQQKRISLHDRINGVTTHRKNNANNLESWLKRKKLAYPFILKKDISACGKDVYLIRSLADIKPFYSEIHRYIFQPFIENTGDFRVFVIANTVIGVIHRRAKTGDHRNNLSKGGTASLVTNKKLLSQIQSLAKKIIALFELDYAGIDLIYDEKSRTLRFLEINSMPGWIGFQKTTDIDVTQKLLQYAARKK